MFICINVLYCCTRTHTRCCRDKGVPLSYAKSAASQSLTAECTQHTAKAFKGPNKRPIMQASCLSMVRRDTIVLLWAGSVQAPVYTDPPPLVFGCSLDVGPRGQVSQPWSRVGMELCLLSGFNDTIKGLGLCRYQARDRPIVSASMRVDSAPGPRPPRPPRK